MLTFSVGSDPGRPLLRFAEALNAPVATTFHGKGVFPDDHPLTLGAVGFERHEYVNFGFDQADTIIAVGYELQKSDPVRINPTCDSKIIHIIRFPAEVDLHHEVEPASKSDIGRTRRSRRPEGVRARRHRGRSVHVELARRSRPRCANGARSSC